MNEIFKSLILALIDIFKNMTLKKTNLYISKNNKFSSVMDLWYRGINLKQVKKHDAVKMRCQISPYIQFFPNNPYIDASRWNQLYTEDSKIDTKNESIHTIAFYLTSDITIRVFPKSDKCVVGLYEQYGYVGEGFIATVDKKLLNQIIPDFYDVNYCGCFVEIIGEIDTGSKEHISIIHEIANKANLSMDFDKLNSIPYIKIKKIIPLKNKNISLLGTPWAATSNLKDSLTIRYCFLDNLQELNNCVNELKKIQNISVFFDDLRTIDSQIVSEKYLN